MAVLVYTHNDGQPEYTRPLSDEEAELYDEYGRPKEPVEHVEVDAEDTDEWLAAMREDVEVSLDPEQQELEAALNAELSATWVRLDEAVAAFHDRLAEVLSPQWLALVEEDELASE